MNNLFDCLNSMSLYSNNPYNSALTHTRIVKTFLISTSKYFINLKKSKKEKLHNQHALKGLRKLFMLFYNFSKKRNVMKFFF